MPVAQAGVQHIVLENLQFPLDSQAAAQLAGAAGVLFNSYFRARILVNSISVASMGMLEVLVMFTWTPESPS